MDSIRVPKSDKGWPYTHGEKCLPKKQEITTLQCRAYFPRTPPLGSRVPRAAGRSSQTLDSAN
jgi:hypothetical protein